MFPRIRPITDCVYVPYKDRRIQPLCSSRQQTSQNFNLSIKTSQALCGNPIERNPHRHRQRPRPTTRSNPSLRGYQVQSRFLIVHHRHDLHHRHFHNDGQEGMSDKKSLSSLGTENEPFSYTLWSVSWSLNLPITSPQRPKSHPDPLHLSFLALPFSHAHTHRDRHPSSSLARKHLPLHPNHLGIHPQPDLRNGNRWGRLQPR